MLRASAIATDQPVSLEAITAQNADPRIPAGRHLLDFTDALMVDDAAARSSSRDALVDQLSPAAAARAAMVAGNFEMMNRVLDATGVPVSARAAEITAELGLARFTGRH